MSTPSLDSDARDVDESRSGSWLESSHLVHGGELGVVKTLVRVSSLDNHVALVTLQSDQAVDSLLGGWDGGRDEFPLWREEESIVKDLRKVDGDKLISHGSDVSVEGHTLEVHVGDSKDGSRRRLVTTSRLDTDESVLDNVNSADTVLSGKSVEGEEDFDGIGDSLAIRWVGDLDGETLGKLNLDLLWGLGCLLWGSGELPHVIGRSLVGVLEDTSFVGNVEEVLVGGPWLGGGLNDGNTVLGGVLEQGGSTGESVVKLGESPWGNDVDGWGETVEGELESDLVVSFTSASVGDEAGVNENPQAGQ